MHNNQVEIEPFPFHQIGHFSYLEFVWNTWTKPGCDQCDQNIYSATEVFTFELDRPIKLKEKLLNALLVFHQDHHSHRLVRSWA